MYVGFIQRGWQDRSYLGITLGASSLVNQSFAFEYFFGYTYLYDQEIPPQKRSRNVSFFRSSERIG